MEKIKELFKDKKNIVITILGIIILCFAFTQSQNQEKMNQLNSKIEYLEKCVEEYEEEIETLKKEKEELKKENKSLSKKEENTEEQEEVTVSNDTAYKNTTKKSTETTKKSTKINDDKTEMVWVGETGTKYHKKDCRTLKGKGLQITLKQALQEGREPCKVCH